MLFLIATPIGNLADISLRALDTLRQSDLILCEDTRRTIKLLNHYQIKKPLLSYHKFNELAHLDLIAEKLKQGSLISLVSDAGTPLISDPGHLLVQRCVQDAIPFTAIPGPCAAINALLLSGFNASRFQFVGFLPKQRSELIKAFQEYIPYPGITICYESPERIAKTLSTLSSIQPNTRVAIAREMTKKFEEILKGNASSLASQVLQSPIKGECILLVEGKARGTNYSELPIEEHISRIEQDFSLTKKEAIKLVASQRNIPKREVYKATIKSDLS
ncbi:MAG: 16S rRNA (cytidine(1402)-2'-O)-methyltransferase [Parachlamydiaceae bacterium]